MKRITMLLGAGMLMLGSMVYAAVPQLINFQGVVKDSAGNTPAVDMLGLTFTIYDAPLGGAALWTESQPVTIVAGGLFSVLLGANNPIPDSVFADSFRWLGIQVETDPEMLPRQRLVSVGYSYRVGTVDGATGGVISGDVSIQSNLTVSDTIKSTSGGVEFPDGSVQTTATLMPIGGVIAWLKSFPNTPALPGNFAECNGQVLNDPQSPYNGQTIPNLNSANRFLQGGTSSGSTGGTASHNHFHTHALFTDTEPLRGTFDSNELHVISGVTGDLVTGPPLSHLPPYYSVVWIMRVK